MKMSPEIAAAAGISFIAIVAASIVLALILRFSVKNDDPDVKALVAEAVAVDLGGVDGYNPRNIRMLWRHTADPNEILVVGVLTAFSDDEYYFYTLLLRYNTGWIVGRIRQDADKNYHILIRKGLKKEQLTKK